MRLGLSMAVGQQWNRLGGAPVPANLTPPTIDNTAPHVGDVLTRTAGTWSGTPVLTGQWKRSGNVIGGETGTTYTVISDDIGQQFQYVEHDSVSNTNAASDPTALVPSNLTTFTVDGVPTINGATVNFNHGTISVNIVATNGGSISTLIIDGEPTEAGFSGDDGDHPCTFTVTAEDGVTMLNVTITLHVLTAGVVEISLIDCSSVSAVAVYAGTSDCTIIISNASNRFGVWISGGVIPQSQPDLTAAYGVTAYIQAPVDFSSVNPLFPDDSIVAIQGWIATAFQNALNSQFDRSSVASSAFTATDFAIGPRADIATSAGSVSVSVTQQGANPV